MVSKVFLGVFGLGAKLFFPGQCYFFDFLSFFLDFFKKKFFLEKLEKIEKNRKNSIAPGKIALPPSQIPLKTP